MTEHEYDVELHTPLGRKDGKLRLQICQGRISGFLQVLAGTEPCQGRVDADGSCILQGRIVTLLQDIDYTGTGRLDGEGLELTLRSERDAFRLTGHIHQQGARD